MIYCTCGQFLVESESRRKFNKLRLDTLSIPHFVIKKGRCHGARHGKTDEQNEYHIAWNACATELTLKVNITKVFTIVFSETKVYRDSQLAIGWTEQKCIEMDELAKQDHTYRLSKEEFKRYQGQWYLTLNKLGKKTRRFDFDQIFVLQSHSKKSLHRESGEEIAEPISPQQCRRWHSFLSDSWWDTSKSWRSS